MKTTIAQEHLARAIARTARVISAKAQLPILQNILLSSKDGAVSITATNLETTIVTSAGAKVTEDGDVCVPAKLLSELVATLPPSPVHLYSEGDALHVSCDGYVAAIPGVPGGEFPPTPTKPKKEGVRIDKDLFSGAVSNVLFAAATDEGRPILAGVKVRDDGNDTTFAATDGYRLAVRKISASAVGGLDLVLPARALAEVVRAASEEKATGGVEFVRTDESQVGFFTGDTDVFTRIIDGEYPNFERIIPKTHTTRATVETHALVKAVKSAAIFARDSANIVRLHIADGAITVSANTPAVGENRVDVVAETEGDPGDIAFNSRFLTDLFGNYADDKIVFEMTGALNPGVFKKPGDDSWLHIIMPVRVQG